MTATAFLTFGSVCLIAEFCMQLPDEPYHGAQTLIRNAIAAQTYRGCRFQLLNVAGRYVAGAFYLLLLLL
eukprot:15366251-Ditylum_brightwellii.AAC.2